MTLRLDPARVGLYAFLATAAAFFLLPLYIMLVTSLKPLDEIRLGNIFALPDVATFEPGALPGARCAPASVARVSAAASPTHC